MARRTTITDIARRAGVSVGTASNVLNDKGRFADETRQRVLKAASDLHFRPNALIRSLQSGRTHAIGVLLWPMVTASWTITMQLVKGAAEGVGEAGCDTVLYSRGPHRGEPLEAAEVLDGRVDGFIFAPGRVAPGCVGAIAAAELPCVALYEVDVPDSLGAVNIENVPGVASAVEHLAALGHRRVAYYGRDYPHDFAERRTGYRLAVAALGLDADPCLDITAPDAYRTGVPSACAHLLSLPEPPTALVASDDSTALLFLQEFAARGVRVPDDVSVVGFDDAPAAAAAPGLTTVRQPAELVGRTAAGFVAKMLEGAAGGNCRVTLPVELVVRGTTAPPRRAPNPTAARPAVGAVVRALS